MRCKWLAASLCPSLSTLLLCLGVQQLTVSLLVQVPGQMWGCATLIVVASVTAWVAIGMEFGLLHGRFRMNGNWSRVAVTVRCACPWYYLPCHPDEFPQAAACKFNGSWKVSLRPNTWMLFWSHTVPCYCTWESQKDPFRLRKEICLRF